MNEVQRSIDEFGSCEVSSGTLRPQDLVPRYLDALREIAPAAYQQIAVPGAGFTPWPGDAVGDPTHEWWQTDEASSLLQSLEETLSEHAPEGFYFGAHWGDGASFGFWPAEEG